MIGYTFSAYLREFGKEYPYQGEYDLRESLFTASLNDMLAHNELYDSGSVTFSKSINQFSDMTPEEVEGFYRGYRHTRKLGDVIWSVDNQNITLKDVPTSYDWRDQGAITPVKNQESCGSCWAFASTETLESHHFIKNSELVVLAPQQLVDCTPNPDHCGGTGGCQGATAELAYTYLQKSPSGLAQESDYPYKAVDGFCKDKKVTGAATVSSFKKLTENSYEDVLNTLATVGPIAVAVDAASWSSYGGGIYTGCDTSENIDIDHLVQLVGYGEDAGQKYWTVRNSWGEGWGESGYIRLERHTEEYCGQDSTPLDGSGCTGGPDVVKVCGTCGILYDTVIPVV